MKRLLCSILLLLVYLGYAWGADYTVAQGEYLDWTLLDDTATDAPFIGTGEEIIPAGAVNTVLNIVVAHIDTNEGTTVTVSVFVQAGGNDNDEDWRSIASLNAGSGTAVTEGLDDNTVTTTIPVDATTDWDTGDGEVLFLKDVGTLVDSCLVQIAGWSDGVSYTSAWAMENAYDASDELYSGVDFLNVPLPAGSEKCMVTFANNDADATYAVRVDYTSATDIE